MTDFENVKRYNHIYETTHFPSEMEQDLKSDYVLHKDYEELLFAYKSLLQQYKQEFINKELDKRL